MFCEWIPGFVLVLQLKSKHVYGFVMEWMIVLSWGRDSKAGSWGFPLQSRWWEIAKISMDSRKEEEEEEAWKKMQVVME